MIRMKHPLKLILILGSMLLLTACASKSYVNDKTAASAARNSSEFLRLDTQLASLDNRIGTLQTSQEAKNSLFEAKTSSLENRLGKIEANTALAQKLVQDGLDRASSANQLTSGKLLYTVTLSDGQIKFASGQAKLSKQALKVLDDLAKKLKAENRPVFIEIQGHTDRVGDADTNKELGLSRAEAVRDALYSAGLPLHRMNVISYGSSQPAVKGNTPKMRAQNRRVLLLVLL
jgi:outer membrane protein OmpA-like peptidoglycan-associated protein